MDRIPYGRRSLDIPTCWNDLTASQLEALADLSAAGLSAQTLKVHLTLHVLRLRVTGFETEHRFRLVRGLRHFTLSAEEFHVLADRLAFVLERSESDGAFSIVSRLTSDPYPHLRGFLSPGAALEHLTYEQFMYAQFYQSQLHDDPSALERLLACLWHRGSSFDAERVEEDAKRLRRLPWQTRQAMLWYWDGSMDFIRRRFPRIFSPASSSEAVRSNVFEDQLRIVDALAGGDMTRKPAVRQGYLYDALLSMDESLRRQEEHESRMRRS